MVIMIRAFSKWFDLCVYRENSASLLALGVNYGLFVLSMRQSKNEKQRFTLFHENSNEIFFQIMFCANPLEVQEKCKIDPLGPYVMIVSKKRINYFAPRQIVHIWLFTVCVFLSRKLLVRKIN